MSGFIRFTVAAAVLAVSVTASRAQIYPLTNGPNGTGPNAVDSAKGFEGSNAVAPEREFLYHPDHAGNAAAAFGVHAAPPGVVDAEIAAHDHPTAAHRRRVESFR